MVTPKEVSKEPNTDEVEQARIEEEIDIQLSAEWLVEEKSRTIHLLPRYKPANITNVLKKYARIGWIIKNANQPFTFENKNWWEIEFELPRNEKI